MSVRFEWHGDRVAKEIRAETGRRVGQAAEVLADRVREEVPVRTGHMRDSIHVGPVEVAGRVISCKVVVADEGALSVEDGTAKVAPNPFMTRALLIAPGEVAGVLGAM